MFDFFVLFCNDSEPVYKCDFKYFLMTGKKKERLFNEMSVGKTRGIVDLC